MTTYYTGPKFPTAAADGGGSYPWSSMTNIFVDDSNYATSDVFTIPGNTNVLKATGFGMTVPSIATITGVLVEIDKNGLNAQDNTISLIKGGTVQGANRSTGAALVNSFVLGNYVSYGGSTDMWGLTLTPSDVNASNFGVAYAALGLVSVAIAQIDAIRVTVYWTIGASGTLPVNVNMPKSHIYKIYSPNYTAGSGSGQYLGNLPNVTTEYQVSQSINTGGAQINIECAISADTSASPVNPIQDETATAILDENNAGIFDDNNIPVVGLGSSNGNQLIRNGNRIVVWEYSYYHPNGIQLFSGTIENWQAPFGGKDGETIKMTVYSDGSDMDNHLVRGYPFTYTLDQSQTANEAYYPLTQSADGSSGFYAGQTFTSGSGVSTLGAVSVYLNGTATGVTVNIYDGPTLKTLLASSSQDVATTGGQEIQFTFAYSIPILPLTQYFLTVTVPAGQSISAGYTAIGTYAGGVMYNGSNTFYTTLYGNQLYFKTFSGNGSTTATFSGMDPTTGLLETVLTSYLAEGGNIGYTSSSIQATGLSLTMGFNTNTVYDAIQSVLSVAPATFYYYVDLGTDTLYFKQANTVADLTFIKGIHMDSINLIATIEQTKNMVYFTGGNTGTSNLYAFYKDASSIGQYGQRLERKSDNRVTIKTTADAIGKSDIAELKSEQYQTTVTIVDKMMDITTIKPGMVVAFRGFGTFVDTILVQIVQVNYKPDEATLTLGLLPNRLVPSFDKITRGLIALNTVANPTTPG